MENTEITGVILAGGQGSRMGGLDKGWISFQGQPLVQHVLNRLQPQMQGPILISANRTLEAYQALGYPVVVDEVSGFQGPLMGLLSALRASQTPWTLCVPCDTPFLPEDLLARLYAAVQAEQADIAFACDPEQSHPVVALLRSSLADDLSAFLHAGERRMMAWYRRQHCVAVTFPQAQAFLNLNHLEDLEHASNLSGVLHANL